MVFKSIDGEEKKMTSDDKSQDQEKDNKRHQASSNNNGNTRKVDIGAIITNLNNENDLDPNALYLDNGAAENVFNNTTATTEIIHQNAIVKDWNGHEVMANGVGTFLYESETGYQFNFKNAIYAPNAQASFISYAKIDRTGLFRLSGQDSKIYITHRESGELAATGVLQSNNLYKLNLKRASHYQTFWLFFCFKTFFVKLFISNKNL